MPISTVIHTNEQSIDRVLAAGAPVLLVFWSKRTPLPAAVESALDKLAQQYAGKAIIAKVDAEAERNLAAKYAPPSHCPPWCSCAAARPTPRLPATISPVPASGWRTP